MFLDLLSMNNKNTKYADLLFIDNKIVIVILEKLSKKVQKRCNGRKNFRPCAF